MKTLKLNEFIKKKEVKGNVPTLWNIEEWFLGRDGVRKLLSIRYRNLNYKAARNKLNFLRNKFDGKNRFFRMKPIN